MKTLRESGLSNEVEVVVHAAQYEDKRIRFDPPVHEGLALVDKEEADQKYEKQDPRESTIDEDEDKLVIPS